MERLTKTASFFAILLGLAVADAAPAQQPMEEAAAPVAAAPPADTPAIAAIKESNPKTAAELVRAVLLSHDLGRDDLAKAYLQKLIDSNPKQEQAVAAYRELGSGRLFRLQTESTLQPLGGEAATILFQRLDDYLKDPDRLKTLVSQLGDPDPLTRKRAIEQLLKAGPDAANPLFAVLGDPAQQALHPAAKKMLVRLDQDIYAPLLAALASENNLLVAQLANVVSEIRLKAAAQYLVGRFLYTDDDQLRTAIGDYCDVIAGSQPDAAQVKDYLSRRVKAYLGSDPMFPVDDSGMVALWIWDTDANQAVLKTMPLADAEVITAGRLLNDLHQLDPSDADIQVNRAMATMQRASVLEDAQADLQALLDEFGLPTIQEALARSLKQRKFAEGAIVACETLGSAQDATVLVAADGGLSSLAQALQSPVYRVRLAAAKAILAIDPQSPYAGSAELMDTLAFLATARGKRVVVIGELDQQRGQAMAGELAQLGFEVVATPGGSEFFKAAYESADVEVIFVSKPLARLPMMETVQVLRKDRRTGDLPIAVIAPVGELDYFELRTKSDPLTLATIRPHDKDGYAFQLQQLYESQGRLIVPAMERAEDAEFAIAALSRMLETPEKYEFYDFTKMEEIAIRRLSDDNVTLAIAKLLGSLATPGAQMALVEYASDPFHPLAFREQCAAEFKAAVARRGILLTKDQMVAQYDRYNASEELDSGTQAVLGKVLDIIEAPTQDVRFDQPAKSGS
ncbi:HEAT repeat domain-containing protein [Blastopirellula marina]|uniref:Response regulatory domain-containing protein n=1 Tax=Blastopirellula marina TaxID=124 RepID=A0A2S8FHN9_9BACT|nr:hypothetical protein [Blastopirellula marina]PQO31682.1 hypothetical protein C5Y98_19915 [Blastopirellula marina]PTL42989.1 hypothetical protein C5Y97_19925 [Blastopirellula marina]